jgi:hypothetical protein
MPLPPQLDAADNDNLSAPAFTFANSGSPLGSVNPVEVVSENVRVGANRTLGGWVTVGTRSANFSGGLKGVPAELQATE